MTKLTLNQIKNSEELQKLVDLLPQIEELLKLLPALNEMANILKMIQEHNKE